MHARSDRRVGNPCSHQRSVNYYGPPLRHSVAVRRAALPRGPLFPISRAFASWPSWRSSPGTVERPSPSVYALFSSRLQCNGLGQEDSYATIFMVSRSFGCMSYPVWYRWVADRGSQVRAAGLWRFWPQRREDRRADTLELSRARADIAGAHLPEPPPRFWRYGCCMRRLRMKCR